MTRLQQTYRHLIQQAITREVMRSALQAPVPGLSWQTGGIAALFGVAAVCGTLAQAHLG